MNIIMPSVGTVRPCSINDFCRLCANFEDNMISIYSDEGVDHMLETKIKTHLPFINISKDDLLPKKICYHCASTVLVWNELYESSSGADHKLRNMFENIQYAQGDNCKNTVFEDIEALHVPVKDFNSIEYEEITDINVFNKDDKSDKTLNELGKVPSTSNTDILNHEHKSSDIQDTEKLIPALKSEIPNIFDTNNVVENEDPDDHNMYLNSSSIDDMDMMDCHTLNLAAADDCCGLVPKREYIHHENDNDNNDDDNNDDDNNDDDNNDDDNNDADNNGADNKDNVAAVDNRVDDSTVGSDGSVISNGNSNGNSSSNNGNGNNGNGTLRCLLSDVASADGLVDVKQDRQVANAAANNTIILKINVSDDECDVVDYECNDNGGDYNNVDIDDEDNDADIDLALAYSNLEVRQVKVNSGADDEEETGTQCQLCATAFKTRYNLLRHFQKRHPEYKMYECDLCRITFQSIDEFKDHLEEKHSKVHQTTRSVDSKQVRFACDVCGNMYKNKASAMNHLLTHTAKKSVSCARCDFTCYTKQQLGVHQTKHDKRFVCDICNKRFAQKSQLDVHRNAVHYNQRPFSCMLCNKSFKTKGSHDAHMIVHTDTRNYQCPHCDKKCRKRYDLTLHIRTHTGEKPFKCSVCGRGFVQMCDTRKHEMLHFRKNKKNTLFFSSTNVLEEDE